MVLSTIKQQISIRPARQEDQRQLANLLHVGARLHRHLDWRSPLDWVGRQPYLVAEHAGTIQAALACPPDPPEIAWIRLFAIHPEIPTGTAWEYLWAETQEYLQGVTVAAIPLQGWFQRLLSNAQFAQTHQVDMFIWESQTPLVPPKPVNCTLRPMQPDDIPAVQRLDAIAFEPIWQQSREMLTTAYRQAIIATVAEGTDGLLGYQISTASHQGGHLARLAVHPQAQGQGIGYAIVHDTLTRFLRRGDTQVTVNTQNNNHASLALYHKAGFRITGEGYPIFQSPLQ